MADVGAQATTADGDIKPNGSAKPTDAASAPVSSGNTNGESNNVSDAAASSGSGNGDGNGKDNGEQHSNGSDNGEQHSNGRVLDKRPTDGPDSLYKDEFRRDVRTRVNYKPGMTARDFEDSDDGRRGRGGKDGRRGRGRGRGGRGGDRGGRGRGRGGGYHQKRNVRTEFERKEESSDVMEIRRQVEFYFSDSNLPIDKFLLDETCGHENKPIPLKTIHSFKRMKHFQPFSLVVEAVKGSDVLDVNDKDEVFRKVPLDSKFTLDTFDNREILNTDTMRRSIYAKGFGEELETTAFDIEELFQPYGIHSVRLRREKDGMFKGSVFVEFESEDAADQFLEMEEKPKYNDKYLQIMSKQEYVEGKNADILAGRVVPSSPHRQNSHGSDNRRGGRGRSRGRGRGRGGHPDDRNSESKRKRGLDYDDGEAESDNWRERRARFQKRERSQSGSRSPYRNFQAEDEDACSKIETT